MGFVHGILTEDEKIKFSKQLQGWRADWYIDKERDVSLWVSNAGNWQELAEGNNKKLARLRIGLKVIYFLLSPGGGSSSVLDKPYIIVWDSIISYTPSDLHSFDYDYVVSLLREGLAAWGGGYANNTKWHPNFVVKFNF
ncbi:hypothetical protein F975_02421 [Acinetobacter sp. ANC 3789]|uniref:hypothetical protein n=1 Tax=Acinetobacter sp. ANC 3789 TaxID=1217714 RepID=UPI0002CF62C6|nr:hypothetical protein [Acinetobacter sp. ANC 3789]ENU79792.1 hypothetical protein F975_02421 [Acinetobacter sp. ANC 3789]